MLASRFLLNSYICSIQDTRNVHNKSPEQNNVMDTKIRFIFGIHLHAINLKI